MALSISNRRQRVCTALGSVLFLAASMGGVFVASMGVGASAAGAAIRTSGSGSGSLPANVKTKAERSLIHLSDLPSGWTAGAAVAASQSSPWSHQLATCVGVPRAIAAIKPTKLSSPDFGSADHTAAVQDSVSVYSTASQARAAFRSLSNGKTPNCMNRIGSQALRASVQNEAGSGATVGTVAISALAPGSFLPGQTGYTVTIPLVSGGQQLTITSTAIEFVRGRFVHQLTFNGNGVAFPALLQVHLTQVVEARS